MSEFEQTPPQYQQAPPQYGQQPPPPQYGQAPPPPQYGQQPPPQYWQQQYEQPQIPPEVCKWNWGAFYFNMLYGIGHKSYLPLLTLIPFFNLVWIFVCGACGMRWAWTAGVEKGEYHPSELHVFLRVQRTWNRAGFVAFWITIAYIAFIVVYVIVLAASSASFGDSTIGSRYLQDAFGLHSA